MRNVSLKMADFLLDTFLKAVLAFRPMTMSEKTL